MEYQRKRKKTTTTTQVGKKQEKLPSLLLAVAAPRQAAHYGFHLGERRSFTTQTLNQEGKEEKKQQASMPSIFASSQQLFRCCCCCFCCTKGIRIVTLPADVAATAAAAPMFITHSTGRLRSGKTSVAQSISCRVENKEFLASALAGAI